MKRLLFVTAALGYGIGGSEKALIEMLKCLDRSLYDISVLSLNAAPDKPFEWEGIKVRYGCDPFLRMMAPLRTLMHSVGKYSFGECIAKFRIALLSRIKKIGAHTIWKYYGPYIDVCEETYDCVIGYGPGLASFYAVDKVKASHKVLWVDTDLQKARFDLTYADPYYHEADRIVVVDNSGIERFSSLFPDLRDRVLTIRNIVPAGQITEMANAETGFADGYDGVRILSVGRLCEAKAFHLAVAAASVLQKRDYRFRWYIIGFGPLEEALKKQIRDCRLESVVYLLGRKTNPYPFFKEADIYVQTSVYEGSPLTVEEALILHCPLVCTDIPAVTELIRNGKNGLVCKMDPESVANAVEVLLRSEEKREVMATYQQRNPVSYTDSIPAFDKMMSSLEEKREYEK